MRNVGSLRFGNPRVTIEVAPEHGDPKFLVEHAKRYQEQAQTKAKQEGDDNLAYDSVYCASLYATHRGIQERFSPRQPCLYE